MLANFGYGALVVAFLTSIYGVGAAIFGVVKKSNAWVASARNAMLLTWPLVTLSALSIILLLVYNQYEIAYVAQVTSNSMPVYLKITALWGGQAGSLVFWAWLMSAFASAVMLRKWDRDREFLPWVIVVSLITLAFFLSLVIFFENPFRRMWQAANGNVITSMLQPLGTLPYVLVDGNGLNPLLRHPGMIIHPPMLYLGFVSFVIPFAFAFAALVTGRTDDRWIRITRRWTLVAWLFLSLGLILGMRWAYDVLGWGGFWGWDPVEIAALLPWLTGTAFLHSVMIQEKSGMLKQWNMVLIILTYDLVIFGTFLTRSGVLSSVHAFAQSEIGPMFFVFIGVTFVVSAGLLLARWNALKAEAQMKSLVSREALFLFQNLVFMSIAFVCFYGVVYPLFHELITNEKITFGPPWYQMTTGPLWGVLLLLMGLAPLAAWHYGNIKTYGRTILIPFALSVVAAGVAFAIGIRDLFALLGFWLSAFVVFVTLYDFWRGAVARSRATSEVLPLALFKLAGRNRRRYGGYIIHLGVVMLALGIIGISFFQTQTQGTLKQGEELKLGQYTMRFDSLAVFDNPDGRNIARAVMDVYKNGQFVTQLTPRRDYYYEAQQPMTIPGVRSTLEDDLYVILVDWQPVSTDGATFKVYHNPLVAWMWIGAFVFIIGAVVATWPTREVELAPARVRHVARGLAPGD